MNIVSVVGARPQFIKAASVSRILRQSHTERLVHTGQHYDYGMSARFFEELDIPQPDVNLGIGSGPHGWQTGQMLAAIERVLMEQPPDWMLVYGDTNSTLAGALAAAKLHIPIAHVEAGLRSFNREMPEEINRVLTDHLCVRLFCPTPEAERNLHNEGVIDGVSVVGDVMVDSALYYGAQSERCSHLLTDLHLAPKSYLLATLHRPRNTDDAARLQTILDAFARLREPIIFPVHPRTAAALDRAGLALPDNVVRLEPVGYLDMLALEKNARLILTDSGGIQKEAYVFSVPCITLREETEWVETVAAGWNTLVGADPQAIVEAARYTAPPPTHPNFYGDGRAAEKIVQELSL
ncbi:MAG: UDP-N-acetylglucosamine 2-epimerase (non-hydrolyzing) [Anaerolineae bacterium]|nr:UDP-N-acetylglucosamine 2-epimerase (non-hydrolyzing) [Anaerolineae bacterium]